MAKLLKIVALFCLLLTSSNFALAENIPAKSATIKKINNLATDITLKINGATAPLSKTELIGWISEKNDLVYNPKYRSEIENQNICLHKKSILCKLTFDIKK